MCKVHRLSYYRNLLGPEYIRLVKQGKIAAKIESRFRSQADLQWEEMKHRVLEAFDNNGEPLLYMDLKWLETLLERHMYETLVTSYKIAERENVVRRKPTQAQFSKVPTPKLPRSLKDLVKIWDEVRKKPALERRANSIYKRVRKEYLKRVQSVWDKYGNDWRAGDTASKETALRQLDHQMAVTKRRVKMIIETETTYYNNHARETFYNGVPEVTHYLYLSVRDHATTKWCKTRHGKVFKKGTQLQARNVPPVHWNCRSEIVPLTPQNPKHKILIDDPTRNPETHYLEPLPAGWGSRNAS